MNKFRRKSLASIVEQLEELKSTIENLWADEELYMDNMPENLQGSERYERAQEACDQFGDAISSMDDVIVSLESVLDD